jgi:predicted permease
VSRLDDDRNNDDLDNHDLDTDDLDRELRVHLEIEAEEQRRAGLSPHDAELAARRALGSTARIVEDVRALDRWRFLDALSRDVRCGMRMLRRDPAFTVTVALTLAIAVGANTALFTLLRNVVLRPLPIPGSDRVVLVYNSYDGAGIEHVGAGGSDYVDRLAGVDAFDEQALFAAVNPSVESGSTVERIHGLEATASFFRVLRVAPRFGRAFVPDDEAPGRNHVVIVAGGVAERLFGTANAVGLTLRLNGEPYAIVGVMPAEFAVVDAGAQLWLPLTLTDRDKQHSHANNWTFIARLKPGATRQRAQAQIDAVNAANLERFPETRKLVTDTHFHSVAVGLQEDLVRDVAPTLTLLWGGALMVMLIAALNIASLIHARTHARGRELATRLALGAGRARIARQLMIEHVLLAVPAAAAGLVAAFAALHATGGLALEHLPPGAELRIDAVVIAYAFGISIAIGAVLGALPAMWGLPASVLETLRSETRTMSTARGHVVRRAVVIAQVSAAFVLLTGAGLLLTSFARAAHADLGYATEGILTASVNLPPVRYATPATMRDFADRALAGLRALPGVRTAALTSSIPLGDDYGMRMILGEGYRLAPGETLVGSYRSAVSEGYFETMRGRLVRGRSFDRRDGPDASATIIIDTRLARRFFPGQDPIGRRMYFPTRADLYTITSATPLFTIVGVVEDMKLRGVIDSMGPIGSYYRPYSQAPERVVTFAMQTEAPPTSLSDAVRSAVARIDPQLPVYDVRTMDQRADAALGGRRMPATVASAFGVVALCLSVVGIYGVLAYLLSQRTREIAIRVALGCTPRKAFALILREGAMLVGSGLALGVAGAALLARRLESQLFGVHAGDPLVLTIALLVLGTAAVVACVLPARRAAHVDPVLALL